MSALDLNSPEEFTPSDPDAPVPAAFKGEEDAHIFENYSFDHVYSQALPITQYHQDIINTIESNSVCVIHGKSVAGGCKPSIAIHHHQTLLHAAYWVHLDTRLHHVGQSLTSVKHSANHASSKI
jgi:hypothetical protein